jgi:hypothetical protein
VVAPLPGCPALETIARFCEGVLVVFGVFVVEAAAVWVYDVCDVPATLDGDVVPAFCMLVWARKAERKLPKNGLFVGILTKSSVRAGCLSNREVAEVAAFLVLVDCNL